MGPEENVVSALLLKQLCDPARGTESDATMMPRDTRDPCCSSLPFLLTQEKFQGICQLKGEFVDRSWWERGSAGMHKLEVTTLWWKGLWLQGLPKLSMLFASGPSQAFSGGESLGMVHGGRTHSFLLSVGGGLYFLWVSIKQQPGCKNPQNHRLHCIDFLGSLLREENN